MNDRLTVVEGEDHRVILNEICKEPGEESTVVDTTMEPVAWLRKQLENGNEELLREMVRVFAETVMSGEADELCGVAYGERSDGVNRRNGYRMRAFDTRVGTIRVNIPSSVRAATSPGGCSSLAGGPRGLGPGGGRVLRPRTVEILHGAIRVHRGSGSWHQVWREP